MKYVIAALFSALLLLGWLYRSTNAELAGTKTALAAAESANKANAEAIMRFERSMLNTDAVLSGWNEDRTTIAGIRDTVRQSFGEVMDEKFKAWRALPVPPDAWRLLLEAPHNHKNSNGPSNSTVQPHAALPGNDNPQQRDKR